MQVAKLLQTSSLHKWSENTTFQTQQSDADAADVSELATKFHLVRRERRESPL